MEEPLPDYPFAWTGPVDTPPEMAKLRDRPALRVRLPSGDVAWLVTRYHDIRTMLSDPRLSKNRNRPDVARMTATKTKVFQRQVDMDPPAHTRMRRLVMQAFTATRVEAMRPAVESMVDDLVGAMLAGGSPGELNSQLTLPLSINVICTLLGVPAQDKHHFEGGTAAPAWDYMRGLIEDKRRQPDDGLISALIAVHDEDNSRLSDHELRWWCMLLLLAGYETTAAQLGGAVVSLLAHPGQFRLLREDPTLAPSAVEELLRRQVVGASLSMLRYVTDDIEVGGVRIPKGASVIAALESANLDETVFEDPDLLDITRRDNRQLLFSAGPHFCVGAALARLEMQVALNRLARIPALRLAVAPEQLNRKDDPFLQSFVDIPVAWGDVPEGV